MREPLAVAGEPRPAVIGMDELSIRADHVSRLLVSELALGRPIWFGVVDRSEASTAKFFAALGPEGSQGIRLAVMDRWQALRDATKAHAPQAAIPSDTFHVLRQLNEAMNQVRKAEYERLTHRADRTYTEPRRRCASPPSS